jgi:hypothetical protein
MVDYDTSGTIRSLDAVNTSNTTILLEVSITGGQIFRAWITLNALTNKISADGVYEGTIGFQAAPIKGLGQNDFAVFGWS